MSDLPRDELTRLDAELADRASPADATPTALLLALVQQLRAHGRSDATVGIQSVLREIEVLERRRLRLGLGDRAVQQ